MYILRIAMILLLALNMQACGSRFSVVKEAVEKDGNVIGSSTPALLRNLPSGDDSYSQGFRHGCKTFLGAVGTGTLRLNNAIIDGYRLSQDRMYARGFSDGGSHCTFYLDWDTH